MRCRFDQLEHNSTDDSPRLGRRHMLAIDTFGHSYAHYAEHLDIEDETGPLLKYSKSERRMS